MSEEQVKVPVGHGRPWNDDSIKPFVRIKNLSKHFGEFAAVDQVSLDIYEGELFSILGGSGAVLLGHHLGVRKLAAIFACEPDRECLHWLR